MEDRTKSEGRAFVDMQKGGVPSKQQQQQNILLK